MPNSDRVRQILSWYRGENPGVLANLARMLNHGVLGGTGKMVILPVDQGFEHGPHRSFLPNAAGMDPLYHFGLAIESGCNAYAAPPGFLEAGAAEHAGEIPLILKCNSSDLLGGPSDAWSAVTATARDALRLGCAGVGFTIYPGSDHRNSQYGEVRELIAEARSLGIPTVIWSYPRGSGLAKDAETALDVVAYAAHVAAELGAHVIKVKPPKALLAREDARKVYEKHPVPMETLADRIRHVVQCCFAGRRVVIFSGGEAKGTGEILEEVRQIHAGGGFGSIMGRNSFQRPRAEALKLLADVMAIYGGR
ncbi:MAG: class I fructose-bisphosphate aldolase [Planctomycetaceae bacterium]|nr:class I fructose-bisphosphate aldolase [Planctomycetota bacterium]NUN52507.1 class I fructose-bisphosphate aldolase [Planctomycetaceae bacterium]